MTGAKALAMKAKNERLNNRMGLVEKKNANIDREDKIVSDDENKLQKSPGCSLFRYIIWFLISKTLFVSLIYYFPVPPFEPKTDVIQLIERVSFVGTLATNEELDKAEVMFEGQIRSPEASADDLSGNLYTGVEGGFILYVNSRRNISTMVAMLNSKSTIYRANQNDHMDKSETTNTFNYCDSDISLYGNQALYSPMNIILSRCSRPLGLRLSPDERYLYVVDPLNGLFKVDLSTWDPLAAIGTYQQIDAHNNQSMAQLQPATLLIDSKQRHKSLEHTSQSRIIMLHDLAVDWYKGPTGGDIIYMTDVSTKWTLRECTLALMEHDDTGRILRYDTNTQQLTLLDSITPVRYKLADYYLRYGDQLGYNDFDNNKKEMAYFSDRNDGDILDERKIIIPNGIALMDKSQALLIVDIGHARILKHYIAGEKAGQTEFWASVGGWPDNIRRGADVDQETYWVACACALSDGHRFNPTDYLLSHPNVARITLKSISLLGRLVEWLGDNILRSNRVRDFGFLMRNNWLLENEVCHRGIVIQYDSEGNVLRSLQTTNSHSKWKFISEAREILLSTEEDTRDSNYDLDLEHSLSDPQLANNQTITTNSTPVTQKKTVKRYLYLFSAVYSYLGRIDLGWL